MCTGHKNQERQCHSSWWEQEEAFISGLQQPVLSYSLSGAFTIATKRNELLWMIRLISFKVVVGLDYQT